MNLFFTSFPYNLIRKLQPVYATQNIYKKKWFSDIRPVPPQVHNSKRKNILFIPNLFRNMVSFVFSVKRLTEGNLPAAFCAVCNNEGMVIG